MHTRGGGVVVMHMHKKYVWRQLKRFMKNAKIRDICARPTHFIVRPTSDTRDSHIKHIKLKRPAAQQNVYS